MGKLEMKRDIPNHQKQPWSPFVPTGLRFLSPCKKKTKSPVRPIRPCLRKKHRSCLPAVIFPSETTRLPREERKRWPDQKIGRQRKTNSLIHFEQTFRTFHLQAKPARTRGRCVRCFGGGVLFFDSDVVCRTTTSHKPGTWGGGGGNRNFMHEWVGEGQ